MVVNVFGENVAVLTGMAYGTGARDEVGPFAGSGSRVQTSDVAGDWAEVDDVLYSG